MMTLYPWQQEQWDYLSYRVKQNTLPHAILLAGQIGMGKMQFARNFVNALLCVNPSNGMACRQCKTCLLVAANNHADYQFIEPEGSDKPIKIDQIRALTGFLLSTPQLGAYKAAIVNRAECMNSAAANALLKTLEEPEGRTIIILITHLPGFLPATIRSRCQIVNFPPTFCETTKQWLAQQLPVPPAEDYLQLAEGAPLTALVLMNGIEERKAIIGNLINIASRELSPIKLATDWQKADIKALLPWLIGLISDIIKLSLVAGDQFIVNKFYFKELQKLALCAKLNEIYDFFDELMTMRQQLQNAINFNQQLLIERILYRWQNCWMEV